MPEVGARWGIADDMFLERPAPRLEPAAPPPPAGVPRPPVPYDVALWVARIGRLVVLWAPLWGLANVWLGPGLRALAAATAFAAIWKLALRRAYADGSVTLWTVGAFVPASVGAVTGGLLVALLVVWVPWLRLDPLGLLAMTGTVLVTSAVWETLVVRSPAARRRVLVVGAGSDARRLVDEVVHTRRLPFDVIGVVADHKRGGLVPRWTLERLAQAVERSEPQLVVLADGGCRARALDRLIEVGHLDFAAVDLPEFYEYAFGRLPVSNLSSDWFMSILHLYRRPYSVFAKRAFDMLLAGLALLLVAPLLPLIALLVRRTPGPVIYRQTRLGEGGRPFTIYKFRTMRQDAERRGAVWAEVDDPRVTPAGRFLRASRLDELPQLWNVLRGDMSVVGPRPERPEFVSRLRAEVPFFLRRHLVKPGITGWAQIHRGYTADAAGTGDKLSYDLWYLRHRSLVVDLAICMRTATTLLTRSGAR